MQKKFEVKDHIPHQSVVPIMLENPDYPDYPFYSGTGFFTYVPNIENRIFFITARHCLRDDADNSFKGHLKIPFEQQAKVNAPAINFIDFIETSYIDSKDEMEDIIIGVIEIGDSDRDQKLKQRALRLLAQDVASDFLERGEQLNVNFRVLGYPGSGQDINYETPKASATSRGFYGKYKVAEEYVNCYEMFEINWKEESMGGLSGSPVIEFIPNLEKMPEAIPLGVLVRTKHFISINVATNIIMDYIHMKNLI